MIEDIIKVVILSLIEGITELLPISSTGHLIVGSALLNFDVMDGLFQIFIQIGAVVAVIIYYRETLRDQAGSLHRSPQVRHFWLMIALASLPAASLGYFFGEQIEAMLFNPAVVAWSLIAGGIAFLLVERLPHIRQPLERDQTQVTDIADITVRQALTVGFLQTLALIPGVSRSGSSIVGGMLAGLNRRASTEFSFFLAIPLLGGATLYRLFLTLDQLSVDQLLLLLLGTVLSMVFTSLTISWLIKYISRNSFVPFGYYRIVVGLLILAALSNGWLS